MKHKWQQSVGFLAVVLSAIAALVPLAGAQTQPAPGQVPSKLGSPDSRGHTIKPAYFAGLVPTRLGSQDPRDTLFQRAAGEHGSAGYGNYPSGPGS